MEDIILIGGSNIDYIATSDKKLAKGVSNIGQLSVSYGGVIRNTVENLARLGNKCTLLTAIGNDNNGAKMRENLISLGITVYTPVTNYPSSAYVAINDSNHDLYVGICDNRILNDLNIKFIKSYDKLIKEHEYIIIDSNLDEETIDYIFETYKDKKIICEAISPEKVKKYRKHLSEIYLLKCNMFEAQSLIDIQLVEKALVKSLLARGIKNVVVSNKSNDIYFGSNLRDIGIVKVEEIKEFKNTTGCGDALFSGVIDHVLQGKSLKKAIEFGNMMASMTLMSDSAVSPEISKLAYKHE